MERVPDNIVVQKYTNMLEATLGQETVDTEGHDGDFIPDGAKDDSVFCLAVGLVLFLLMLILVVLLAVRATKGKKRLRQKCPNCGVQNKPGGKFCNSCGQPLQ